MRKIARKYTLALAALALAALAAALMTATGMAHAQAAPEIWFIRGVVALKAGGSRITQFMVPDQDNGRALLTFTSKDACEDARENDPNIAGPLTVFEQVVKLRGDSVVVSCEQWEHPPVKPKGEDI